MNKSVHYIGLDVHKDSIAVAIAPGNSTEVRRYGIIGGTIDAVDKLLKRLSQPNIELRLVYEAGPCGFVLCRHLRSKAIHCDLVCPSLIPKKASDRVKTDRRDADQLARLYRAGELSPIHVPNVAPHLPPPGKQVSRNKDIQICAERRAESAGGG